MRVRPLSRTDAWRVMEHTLYIRGAALVALALCGLRWPELALTIVLADIGLICLLFALADLFVAWAIRPLSMVSARKIGVLGLMGLGLGSVTLAIPILSLPHMLTAIMTWLLVSGCGVMLWGGSLPRRERASSIIAEWGAVQLLLAFLLPLLRPTNAMVVLQAGAAYAGSLGMAQVGLGLLLRRGTSERGEAVAA
jgi:hypothetical protein